MNITCWVTSLYSHKGQLFQTLIHFQIPDGLPNSFLDAVRRYGTSTNKAPAISVVDHHGKIVYTLLYGMVEIYIFCFGEF